MNQGIVWTIIVVLVLIVVAAFAWNVTKQSAVEPTPSAMTSEPAMETLPPDEGMMLASPTPMAMADASVTASTQKKGTSVTVDSVYLTQPGFVVIHADSNGKPGTVLGHSALLTAGQHDNVVVKVTRTTKTGETLYAMLHNDANNDGKYEYPGADVPTTNSAGAVVMMSFTIGTPSASASPSASAAPLYSY